MVENVDQARVEDGVNQLLEYTNEEIFAICRTIFQRQDKLPLLQDVVDWACPDFCFGNARVLLENRYQGHVKSFNEQKGWGFVTSDEAAASFGKDIFLSSHQLQNTGIGVGDKISFVILSNKGKPQAFDLQPLGKKGGARAPVPMPMMNSLNLTVREGGLPISTWEPPRINNPAQNWGPKGAALSQPPIDETRFMGFVKSYNAKNAYGFITCEDLMMIYGKADIFVSDKELGGIEVGSQVSFKVTQDNVGKPYAVQLAPPGGLGNLPLIPQGKGGAKAPPGIRKDQSYGEQRFYGFVKSFNAKNQYGFILAEELAAELGKPDIFVSAAELGGIEPGSDCSFQVAVDEKGKAFAVNVESTSIGGAAKKARFA